MKSTLLAIDTSTDACSVALLHNGCLFSNHQLLPREHTQNILPMVEALLSEHKITMEMLDGFVVGAGPGSFTGLRIAFGVIQGLAFAADKPVATVSTLTALAVRTRDLSSVSQGEMITTVDARMNELYWARYRFTENALTLVTAPGVSKPADIELADVDVLSGTGLVYQDQLQGLQANTELFASERPRAVDMLEYVRDYPEQVQWQPASLIEPLYVRNDVAKKKADQQK
jgi:tRNA threonylcarbamoyladenosine biosynthesis protein TsaB